MELTRTTNRRSWGLAVIVFIAGLLILEIILRTFVYKIPENAINDADWGHEAAKDTYFFQATEGYGLTHYIENGEIATPFTGGSSIVVMGDSFTEGLQVNDDEKYASISEKILRERGYEVDIHNLGSSGLRVPDHIYRFDKIKEEYKPEIVVLQIDYANFLSDQNFNENQRNYFVEQPDGTLKLQHKSIPVRPAPYLLTLINRSTSLVGYGYNRLLDIKSKILRTYTAPDNIASNVINGSILENKVLLAKISLLEKEFAGEKVIIILASPFPTLRNGIMIMEDPRYNDLVTLFQRASGWEVVDPSAKFMELYHKGRFPSGFNNSSLGEGHWNIDGHAIVGTLLADALEKILQ